LPGMRLIAGSGRSGTTWVQDALADANDLRPIFEPLHPWVSELGVKYSHKALSADEEHPDLRQFMADVSAGRRNRLWTRYRRQSRLLFPPAGKLASREGLAGLYRYWEKFLREFPDLRAASRRPAPLFKDIRANLMLGWLARHCDCRTVLILRHPGAVLESEMRGGWNAGSVLDRFRRDPRLHALTGGRYRALLARELSPVEALATRWVIENQWPVERATDDGVTVVHYEHLKSTPETEWPRMCRALELTNVPSEAVRARPSQQSATEGSAASQSSTRQPGWMKRLTEEQIAHIQGVLDEVGFTLYTMDAPEPKVDDRQARVVARGAAC
jgi:hypothetical protein